MIKLKANKSKHIYRIKINGLNGRILTMPAKTKPVKNEILLVYGHHASLERMYGLAEELSNYGNVTMPDLPGFGGMDSFYKIKEKPSLDNLADYLATIIKLKFQRKQITIIGMSFGFVIVCRMLQKYPEMASKVKLTVSLVGFAHKDDFIFKKSTYFWLRWSASWWSNYLPAQFLKIFIIRAPIIRWIYWRQRNQHSKLIDADEDETIKRINFEVILWKINDIRTYMDTAISLLTVNLCYLPISGNVCHIYVDNDRYLNNQIVEQHLKIIFKKVTMIKSKLGLHAPTVVATAADAAQFIPKRLRTILIK